MKYLVILTLLFSACKKESTVTWKLSKGATDVVVTEGTLNIDFQSCPEGWQFTRPSRKVKYRIWTMNAQRVEIWKNGCLVSWGEKECTFDNR